MREKNFDERSIFGEDTKKKSEAHFWPILDIFWKYQICSHSNVMSYMLTGKVSKWLKVKVKVESSTCYSASYIRQTQDQKRFDNVGVAADWYKLLISQRTMRPSTAHVDEQLDPWLAASRHTTAPISHTRPSPIARKLLHISRPTEGRRLSWPEHIVG